jgi:glycosyltransferase involved in cell wall biosynthesis
MKILHVTTHLNIGGITTYLRALTREQRKAGHEVHVWGAAGVCSGEFRSFCTEVIDDVPRCKSELSPRLWSRLPRMISFLKSRKIDMIHTHTRVAQVLCAAARPLTGVPYISTAHMFYKKRLGRRLFPCWGSAVIANSGTMRDGLFDTFGKNNLPQVTVAVNGIDVEGLRAKVEASDRDACRTGYGCLPGEIVILSLARLIPVKGVHLLLESFALALKEVPNLRLLVAGSGDDVYEAALKKQAAELGILDKTRFLGNVIETEKPFRAADLFVAPYLWPEAFGLSILEAMAAGLPVIGSRSGGIGELLCGGKYGLLFEEKDIRGLADGIVRYAGDPELRSRMGRAGGEAAHQYTARKMYEKTQAVYREVLERI